MRVLIADEFEQSGRDELQALGCEVRFAPKLKDEALVADVEQFRPDVLVVRGTKVPEAVLAAGALKLVVRAGAGYNTIDVAAASRRGIYVSNCPGKNSIAVAELAFGLILALDRQIPDNVIALRQGQWNKSAFSKARGLYGRTLRTDRPGTNRPRSRPARQSLRPARSGVEPQPDRRCRAVNSACSAWTRPWQWLPPPTSSASTSR